MHFKALNRSLLYAYCKPYSEILNRQREQEGGIILPDAAISELMVGLIIHTPCLQAFQGDPDTKSWFHLTEMATHPQTHQNAIYWIPETHDEILFPVLNRQNLPTCYPLTGQKFGEKGHYLVVIPEILAFLPTEENKTENTTKIEPKAVYDGELCDENPLPPPANPSSLRGTHPLVREVGGNQS